jgi:hypothetical protein
MIYVEYNSLSCSIYLPYLKWWAGGLLFLQWDFSGYKSTEFLLTNLGVIL